MCLCGGAARGGGDAGRRPRADACCGSGPRRARTPVARNEGRLLSEPVLAGTGGRSAAGAADQVPGSDGRSPVDGRSETAQPARLGTRGGTAKQTGASVQATATCLQEARADGRGDDGRQRSVRLADGRGSEASWLGACPPQSLRLRRPAVQLDTLRNASAALGLRRHFGFRPFAGVSA